ncbi:MAG: hypothetical protein LBU32_18690 [Clostridiales bacterium]|nr:hypothetical protein [Clostridiales bacterium]
MNPSNDNMLIGKSIEIIGAAVNANLSCYGSAVSSDGDFTMSSGTLNISAPDSSGTGFMLVVIPMSPVRQPWG